MLHFIASPAPSEAGERPAADQAGHEIHMAERACLLLHLEQGLRHRALNREARTGPWSDVV
eukprot:9825953-Lingulodinium_polyedra.AAC.1